jgi:hypothetical protein
VFFNWNKSKIFIRAKMEFTEVQKTFMIESYFRNALQINVQLVCEARPCLREFSEKFLDVATTEVNFANTLSYAKLFCETESIKRKSGSGKPTERTPELLKM